jgi:hypothetical protein
VATDGRLVGIDDFNPLGKIAQATDRIHAIWHAGKEPARVQMVFLDLGVPQSKAKRVSAEEGDEGADPAAMLMIGDGLGGRAGRRHAHPPRLARDQCA